MPSRSLQSGRPVTFGGGINARWGGGANQLLQMGSSGHAVLSIWRPGEAGGDAVVDVALGVVQPGGRLSQPWPRSVGYVHSRAAPWWNLHQGDCECHLSEAVFSPLAGCRAVAS